MLAVRCLVSGGIENPLKSLCLYWPPSANPVTRVSDREYGGGYRLNLTCTTLPFSYIIYVSSKPRRCRYKLFHTDLAFHTVCLDWLNFCFLGAKFNLSYECGGSSVQISIFLMNVVAHLCKFCSAKFNLCKIQPFLWMWWGNCSSAACPWLALIHSFQLHGSSFTSSMSRPLLLALTFLHTKSLSRPFSRGAAKRPLERALTVAFTRSPTRPLVHYWPGLTLDNLRAFDAIGSAPHFLPPAGLLCFVLLQNLATLCNLTCNLATPLYYWVPATHLQQPSVQFLLSNLSSLLIAAHSQTVSHILSPFLVENVSWGWTNQQPLIGNEFSVKFQRGRGGGHFWTSQICWRFLNITIGCNELGLSYKLKWPFCSAQF